MYKRIKSVSTGGHVVIYICKNKYVVYCFILTMILIHLMFSIPQEFLLFKVIEYKLFSIILVSLVYE